MKKRSNLLRLLDYAGNYRYLTYASCIMAGISALIALLPFVYIWEIIKEIITVMPNYDETKNISKNGNLALFYSIISILLYVCSLLCSHLAAFRIATNIRIKAMKHIVTLPMGFMDKYGSGKLRKIINESSAATETYLAHQLPDKVTGITTPLGLLSIIIFFDIKLGILCIIPVIIAFAIIGLFMSGKKLQQGMSNYQSALDRMSNEAVEYVRGVPILKTFGQSVFSFKKFRESINDYEKLVIHFTKDYRIPMIAFITAINSIFAILIAYTLYLNNHNEISTTFILNLIFYIIITPIITITLNKIMYGSEENMLVSDALEKIDSIFKIKKLEETPQITKPIDNSIVFENVYFSYSNSKNNVLNNISLRIDAGKHIALVGHSGSGKTTLASLVARFWDVKHGNIKIGNVNIKNISKNELTKIISFVFQDSKLIKGTIKENLMIANSKATEKELLTALHLAQCDDIIEKLPLGINTIIGTSGIYLSGGEQQRITIARMILRDSPIIILDEATAYADPDNEHKVQLAFSSLSKNKTIIMIAHRLSTVINADIIFVLEKGEIVESGSHNELINQKSVYFKMWMEYKKVAHNKFNKISNNITDKNQLIKQI